MLIRKNSIELGCLTDLPRTLMHFRILEHTESFHMILNWWNFWIFCAQISHTQNKIHWKFLEKLLQFNIHTMLHTSKIKLFLHANLFTCRNPFNFSIAILQHRDQENWLYWKFSLSIDLFPLFFGFIVLHELEMFPNFISEDMHITGLPT